MRHGRKPVEFAAILFFPPPGGGGGAGAGWESVPVLRLGGATGMAAGSCGKRGKRARVLGKRAGGRCGAWVKARTPFPPFPQARDEWRRRVWKAWKARTPPARTGSGSPQRGGSACALPTLPTPTP